MVQAEPNTVDEIVLIGGAAESNEALKQLLSQLKPGFSLPIIIVGHNIELLKGSTGFDVTPITSESTIIPATVYVAPSNYHLSFEKDNTFSLNGHNNPNGQSAIDTAFSTAADIHASAVIGIALPGAYVSGAKGLEDIKNNGGVTIVHSADADSIDDDVVDMVMDANGIAEYLNEL